MIATTRYWSLKGMRCLDDLLELILMFSATSPTYRPDLQDWNATPMRPQKAQRLEEPWAITMPVKEEAGIHLTGKSNHTRDRVLWGLGKARHEVDKILKMQTLRTLCWSHPSSCLLRLDDHVSCVIWHNMT